MKQTAVEWLIDQMFKQGYFDGNKPLSITNLDHLQHQAKEMEKQQIIDALTYGNKMELMASQKMFAEQYYTSTYGSKGSDEPKNDYAKCWIIDNVDYWEKTLEYWKAEKEIANIGSTYYGLCCARIGIIEDFFKYIQPINTTSSQTEISDEEIEEMLFHHSNEYAYGFKDAIKWYREQLKSRQ